MTTSDGSCKIKIMANIDIDLSAIATFNWSETNAARLRERRESVKYTREKLSEATEISIAYLQQLEVPRFFSNKLKSGKPTVSAEVLQKICNVIGGDVISLIWDIDTSIH